MYNISKFHLFLATFVLLPSLFLRQNRPIKISYTKWTLASICHSLLVSLFFRLAKVQHFKHSLFLGIVVILPSLFFEAIWTDENKVYHTQVVLIHNSDPISFSWKVFTIFIAKHVLILIRNHGLNFIGRSLLFSLGKHTVFFMERCAQCFLAMCALILFVKCSIFLEKSALFFIGKHVNSPLGSIS